MPSPANPQALNRYSYVVNNPLLFSDPTGHAYEVGAGGGGEKCGILCRLQGRSPRQIVRKRFNQIKQQRRKAEVTKWVQEKNVPTAVGAQGSGSVKADFFAGYSLEGQGQFVFNWYSGHMSLLLNTSEGGYVGTPDGLSVGGAAGVTAIWGASRAQSLPGPYNYYSVEAGVDAFVKGTAQYSESRAVNYVDKNQNREFDREDTFIYLFNLYEDPIFERSVVARSLDVAIEGNAIPNGPTVGVYGGIGQSSEVFSVDIYRWLPFAPPWYVREIE